MVAQIVLAGLIAAALTLGGVAGAFALELENHTLEGYDFETLGALRRYTDNRFYTESGKAIRARGMRLFVSALSVLFAAILFGLAVSNG